MGLIKKREIDKKPTKKLEPMKQDLFQIKI